MYNECQKIYFKFKKIKLKIFNVCGCLQIYFKFQKIKLKLFNECMMDVIKLI